MKCPYCAREIKEGYIMQCHWLYPLTWMPKDRVGGVRALFMKQGIKLTSVEEPELAVAYCEACRKFVVDQEEIKV